MGSHAGPTTYCSLQKTLKVHVNLLLNWVVGGLLVKLLNCGSKGLAAPVPLVAKIYFNFRVHSAIPPKLAPLTVPISTVSIHREMRMDLNQKTLVSQEYCTGFVDCRHTNSRS